MGSKQLKVLVRTSLSLIGQLMQLACLISFGDRCCGLNGFTSRILVNTKEDTTNPHCETLGDNLGDPGASLRIETLQARGYHMRFVSKGRKSGAPNVFGDLERIVKRSSPLLKTFFWSSQCVVLFCKLCQGWYRVAICAPSKGKLWQRQ